MTSGQCALSAVPVPINQLTANLSAAVAVVTNDMTNTQLLDILTRYQVTPNHNFPAEVDPRRKNPWELAETDLVYRGLQERWKDRIEPGWYGFDLTRWLPNNWYFAINAFLTWLEARQPEFKIRQIKLKFGTLRIHVSYPVEDLELREEIFQFSRQFHDAKLIY